MAFTTDQKAAVLTEINTALARLTNAKTTLEQPVLGTQTPVSVHIRAAMEQLLNALMICGAAIED